MLPEVVRDSKHIRSGLRRQRRNSLLTVASHVLGPVITREYKSETVAVAVLDEQYLLLVDYMGRLVRNGKARLSSELAGVLDRLGTSAEFWQRRIEELFAKSRLTGSYFATDRGRLLQIAALRGVHHVDNEVSLVAR